jgi:diketogulonate reductase-like aldo/keto reductase
VQKTLEAYRSLESAVSQGKIGQLGVSNIYDPAELMWLMGKARVPVSVVQNRYASSSV